MRLRFAAALALLASPAFAEDKYEQFHFFDKGLVCSMVEVTALLSIAAKQDGTTKGQALEQTKGLLRPMMLDVVEAAYEVDLGSTTAEDFARQNKEECDAGMLAAQQPIYDQLNAELARLSAER